jgi:hypothetical protein
LDKIIPFNIEIEEKEIDLLCLSRISDRPIKWQENTGDNDNTREEKRESLRKRYFTIPMNNATISNCRQRNDSQRLPKGFKKESNIVKHNVYLT